MEILDFHVHAFPDALAERAIPALEAEGGVKARLDGKVSSLLRSMDEAGIDRAVVCSIATKPEQFRAVLEWSRSIASPRLIPFPSIHPRDPDIAGKARAVKEAGLLGVKLHPYYQDFDLDAETMFPLYREMEALGLVLVSHTGFDFAFERIRRGDPARILKVLEAFPSLKFVATHLGAWEDWDEVRKHLIGKPVWMEISMSLEFLGRDRAREMLLAHPEDRVLFGTDSPWTDQRETLALARALDLGPEREALLLGGNARRLLG
jgi:predicted TIM-barrel fold metal-dependent hydrolase